jgi:hypothetical protein
MVTKLQILYYYYYYYYIERRPSSEADRFLAGQEIPCIL